jgi:signal transduction histidine kinase
VGRAAQVILDEARHATRLLGNILGLSEIDAGEAVVQQEEVDSAVLVGRCMRRVESRAAARGLEVRKKDGARTNTALRSGKVERALDNLLENAVKFAARWIELDLRQQEPGGREVVISVRNDGPPIAAEHAPRIFERFYRSGAHPAGTGLGLAIAKELIELNGGTLQLPSAGTPVEFRIVLPARAG